MCVDRATVTGSREGRERDRLRTAPKERGRKQEKEGGSRRRKQEKKGGSRRRKQEKEKEEGKRRKKQEKEKAGEGEGRRKEEKEAGEGSRRRRRKEVKEKEACAERKRECACMCTRACVRERKDHGGVARRAREIGSRLALHERER